MTIYGYSRVSTNHQSHAVQLDILKNYKCKKIFRDTLSGGLKRRQRPGLNKALKYLKPGDKLVVQRIDRLGRSTLDTLNTLELINQKKAFITSHSEHLDTEQDTHYTKLLVNMLSVFAEMERTHIAERVIAGLDRARRLGRIGGQPKKLEANKLKSFIEDCQNGLSIQTICQKYQLARSTYFRYRKRYMPGLKKVVAMPKPLKMKGRPRKIKGQKLHRFFMDCKQGIKSKVIKKKFEISKTSYYNYFKIYKKKQYDENTKSFETTKIISNSTPSQKPSRDLSTKKPIQKLVVSRLLPVGNLPEPTHLCRGLETRPNPQPIGQHYTRISQAGSKPQSNSSTTQPHSQNEGRRRAKANNNQPNKQFSSSKKNIRHANHELPRTQNQS